MLTGQALLCAVTLSACGPKLVRVSVYESPDQSAEVFLRHQEQGGEKLPRGYDHPALISDVRLAHILAHLQYEDRTGNKHPLIRSLQVYDLAEGLAKGLKQAGPEVLGSLGSNPASGLALALEKLKRLPGKSKAVVILSDGEENRPEKLEAIAQEAALQGIKVYTVGYGSEDGAPIPIGRDFWGKTRYRIYRG